MKIGVNLFGMAVVFTKDYKGTLNRLHDMQVEVLEPCVYYRDDTSLKNKIVWLVVKLLRRDGGWWLRRVVKSKIDDVRRQGFIVNGGHVLSFPTEPELIRSSVPEMISLAKENQLKYLAVSPHSSSIEEAKKVKDALKYVSDELQKNKIDFVFHNHPEALANDNGDCVLSYLLREIPSAKVQLDVGWVMIGGADIIEVMKRYKDQICSIHFKDFCKDVDFKKPLAKISAVGDGTIPLKEIVKEAANLNLYEDGFIIDQDWSQGDIFSDIEIGVKNIRNA